MQKIMSAFSNNAFQCLHFTFPVLGFKGVILQSLPCNPIYWNSNVLFSTVIAPIAACLTAAAIFLGYIALAAAAFCSHNTTFCFSLFCIILCVSDFPLCAYP
jgi:hypothetical protein